MGKNIKDYLHLYKGCTIRRYNKYLGHLDGKLCGFKDGFNENYILVNHGMSIVRVAWNEDFKPILRPLSDMTVDEKYEFNNIDDCIVDYDGDILSDNHSYISLNKYVPAINWLRFKHFDVDGLIESGLAIDATTLTTPQI